MPSLGTLVTNVNVPLRPNFAKGMAFLGIVMQLSLLWTTLDLLSWTRYTKVEWEGLNGFFV